MDVEPEKCRPDLERDRNILGLSESDLAMNGRLIKRLEQRLAAQKIAFLNLADELKKYPEEELYWKKDYHLNVQGHKHVAEAVYSSFRPVFDRHAP
jgi:hypothetical protein